MSGSGGGAWFGVDRPGASGANRPVDDLLPHMAADPDGSPSRRLRALCPVVGVRRRCGPGRRTRSSWGGDGGSGRAAAPDHRRPSANGRTGRGPGLSASGPAVYLGGTRAVTLARVGTVAEGAPGAAARLDAALAVPLAPYMNDDF